MSNIFSGGNSEDNWAIDPLGMFPQYDGGASPVGKTTGSGTLDRYRSNEIVPTSNNATEIKLWKDDNPDWDNLQAPMKDATTAFVSDVNKEFGTGKTPWITSGYRSPERNASIPGASPNSWHVEGMAVDINLEDYTPEERDKIEKMARERFGEVLFHDAGTGLHLHIGNPLIR